MASLATMASTIDTLPDSEDEDESETLTACVMKAPYVVLQAAILANSPVLVAAVLALPDISLTHNSYAAFKAVVDTDNIDIAIRFCHHPSCKSMCLQPLVDRATRQGHYHMAELLLTYIQLNISQ